MSNLTISGLTGTMYYDSGFTITTDTGLTYTSNSTISNMSNIWHNAVWSSYEETINVLGKDIQFSYLSENQRLTLAILNFNGHKFWHHLKGSGITFGDEIDELIDKQVLILSRKDKLESIEKKKT